MGWVDRCSTMPRRPFGRRGIAVWESGGPGPSGVGATLGPGAGPRTSGREGKATGWGGGSNHSNPMRVPEVISPFLQKRAPGAR